MIASIKSEFRKLLTVRSTYIILGIGITLEFIACFYGSGWKSQAIEMGNPNFLSNQVTSILVPLTLLAGIIAVLLISHEYRYNTIMYTLTSSKSRTRVLVSKIFVISCFAIVFALFFGLMAPILAKLGLVAHGLKLGHQYLPIWSLIWRSAFYCWGFVMLASILAFIIRIQVGALAAMFLIPTMVEQLLGGLLLKANQVYLPFSALGVLTGDSRSLNQNFTYMNAVTIAGIYIIVGWIVAWVLFVKRDAI